MINHRTAPWFFCPAAAWESARERLPRPFDREEAIADLRWWWRQVRLGRDDPQTGRPLARMPGRARLVADWGWDQPDRVHTPAAVRKLLADVLTWHPPSKGDAPHCPKCARALAALEGKKSARKVPKGKRTNADNGEKSASEVPADSASGGAPGGSPEGEAPAKRQQSASAGTDKRQQSAEKRQQSASEVPSHTPKAAGNPDNGATDSPIGRQLGSAANPLPPTVLTQAQDPAEERLLLILARWTADDADAPTQWLVRWEDVLPWWRSAVLGRADYKGLDLGLELERWDNHLERAAVLARQAAKGKGPRFPEVWKNALHTWFSNAVRYAARQTGATDHDRAPRRATRRRRGQQGETRGLFDLAPLDAGDGLE